MHASLISTNTQTDLVLEVDLLAALLADKRSDNTKRAYAKDLRDFFLVTMHQPLDPSLVADFLQLDRFAAISLVLQYKAGLMERGLSELRSCTK